MTTPEAYITQILATGLSDLQSETIGNDGLYGVSATGSDIDTAYLLTKEVTVITSTTGTAIKMNPTTPLWKPQFIRNNTASILSLYPDSDINYMNSGSSGSAVALLANTGVIVIRVSSDRFVTF